MKELVNIFQKNHGFGRMKELKNHGVHTRTISSAIKEGIIIKIKPGIYKLVDYPYDQNEFFRNICEANSKAVICLHSAAAYYELSTYDPAEIYVAVPHHTSRFNLEYPPIKVFYFSEKFYKPGIKEIETKSGRIKIYDIEKTIIDLFRYKSKLGEDVALESLKNYIKNKKNKINPMIKVAIELGVYKRMEPFIKGAI